MSTKQGSSPNFFSFHSSQRQSVRTVMRYDESYESYDMMPFWEMYFWIYDAFVYESILDVTISTQILQGWMLTMCVDWMDQSIEEKFV